MASPSAIIMVVEVVGAMPMAQDSGASGSSNATSAARARVESALHAIAITGMRKRLA